MKNTIIISGLMFIFLSHAIAQDYCYEKYGRTSCDDRKIETNYTCKEKNAIVANCNKQEQEKAAQKAAAARKAQVAKDSRARVVEKITRANQEASRMRPSTNEGSSHSANPGLREQTNPPPTPTKPAGKQF